MKQSTTTSKTTYYLLPIEPSRRFLPCSSRIINFGFIHRTYIHTIDSESIRIIYIDFTSRAHRTHSIFS
ncbi:hypothetical protein Hanom_Chr10g00937451 [Helianthus anomalus]